MLRVVLLAAVAAALVAAGDASPTGSKTTLQIAKRAPVTVVGAGFEARERVRVRVMPAGRNAYAKTVTATAAGRLTAVFTGRSLSECVSVRIVATGDSGSRATGREIPPPGACGVDLTD